MRGEPTAARRLASRDPTVEVLMLAPGLTNRRPARVSLMPARRFTGRDLSSSQSRPLGGSIAGTTEEVPQRPRGGSMSATRPMPGNARAGAPIPRQSRPPVEPKHAEHGQQSSRGRSHAATQ